MMFKYVCLVLFITWYQLSADGHPAKTDVRAIDSMIDKVRYNLMTITNYITVLVIVSKLKTKKLNNNNYHSCYNVPLL